MGSGHDTAEENQVDVREAPQLLARHGDDPNAEAADLTAEGYQDAVGKIRREDEALARLSRAE